MKHLRILLQLLISISVPQVASAKTEGFEKVSSLLEVMQARFNSSKDSICGAYQSMEGYRKMNVGTVTVGYATMDFDSANPKKSKVKTWNEEKTVRELASETRETYAAVILDFHGASDEILQRYHTFSKQSLVEEKKIKEKAFQLEKELEAEPNTLCSVGK